MRIRTLGILGCAVLLAAGCGRFGDSRLNPLGWFGGSNQPTTLAPEGGYPTVSTDGRVGLAQVTGAKWDPLYEGRLLVVTGLPATKGWWKVALVTEVPMPPGRITPDENGVLRLRLVGNPPAAGSAEARMAPHPASDTVTVAMTLSNETLANIREVVITGATNAVTLRR